MTLIEMLHFTSFGILIAAAFLAVAVGVERIIFSSANMRRAKMLIKQLDQSQSDLSALLGKDVVSDLIQEVMKSSKIAGNESAKQDYVDAAYIHARDALFDRMWLLDTIVTAAPLLGLLGTIFGIVDTFLVLSKSGMSDPSGVSAGIGTALYATALGIFVALVGLLIFNYLTNKNERISEYLKILILRVQ